MSLNTSESDRGEHPVDMVERLAQTHAWPFNRDGEDEISLTVAGRWSDYQVSFTWLDEVEALHLACAFDVKLNARRRSELLSLIALINEQLWIGHFGLWETEKMVIFRHSLLLSGGVEPTRDQCEALLNAAVKACESYYQSFQFVLWAGRTAREALDAALFETAGEA